MFVYKFVSKLSVDLVLLMLKSERLEMREE